jgi:DNA-binding transcriptional LysR family regulator
MCEYPFILVHPSALGEQALERFRAAGLDLNVAVHAVNADMTKDFVLAGLGVGLIPTFAFLAARDRGLAARDASHLFEPVVSSVLLRRRSHLPQYVYDFLQMLDASLDRERMEPLIFERE